jgi:hypothetical protein
VEAQVAGHQHALPRSRAALQLPLQPGQLLGGDAAAKLDKPAAAAGEQRLPVWRGGAMGAAARGIILGKQVKQQQAGCASRPGLEAGKNCQASCSRTCGQLPPAPLRCSSPRWGCAQPAAAAPAHAGGGLHQRRGGKGGMQLHRLRLWGRRNVDPKPA